MNSETCDIEPVIVLKERYPYAGVWYLIPTDQLDTLRKMNRNGRRNWLRLNRATLEVVGP